MIHYDSFYCWIKSIVDRFLSFLGLILLIPIYLFIVAGVFFSIKRPIFFAESRIGIQGRSFKLYKFRTMSFETDESNKLLPDNLRLSKFGKFLRNSGLDELPQLYNIFKGEMSFVGPRPLPEKYRPLFSGQQFLRHNVRPGVTGLAQVLGGNNLSWKERFEADLDYLDKVNFKTDFVIVLKTFKAIHIKREFKGLNSSYEDYSPDFNS